MPPFKRPILARLPVTGKVFGMSLGALVLPFMLAFSANAATLPDPDLWQTMLVRAQAGKDPLAAKLGFWVYASQASEISRPVRDMMTFVESNPDWPRLWAIRDKIEQDIGGLDKQDIIAWFKKNPPQSGDGIESYIAALRAAGLDAEARHALAAFWTGGALTRQQMQGLATRHQALLTIKDHLARADNLVWDERFDEARDMMPMLPAADAAVIAARLSLAQQLPDINQKMQQVPVQLQNDEGYLFERLRWRRREDLDEGAREIIRLIPKVQKQPDKWWKELGIMARRSIEAGDYKTAYAIAARHGMTKGGDYAQAEFILGWLSLSFLNQPVTAFNHFDSLYRGVDSAISRSRAAYWAARAADAAGNQPIARQWDEVSAHYISTFYGQLSYRIVYGVPNAAAMEDPATDKISEDAFNKNEMTRVIRLLHKLDLDSYSDPFFAKLIDNAKTPAEYTLAAKLALSTGNRRYAVQANKDLQQKQGGYIFKSGYPQLQNLGIKQPDLALVHAIIYRESMFDQNAASTAGALGLMQLMPRTAREVAKKQGIPYTQDKLTANPAFNTKLGAAYLQQMIEQYGGYYPLAIAAYNAGPGNVSKWLREIGDPRDGKIDIINWIEMIPIYETRNYVQRVMETHYIYSLKMKQKPATVLDLKK